MESLDSLASGRRGRLPFRRVAPEDTRDHAADFDTAAPRTRGGGLVHRMVYAEVPPHTEYRQTEPARDLSGVYMELKRWSHAHRDLLVARVDKSRK